MGEFEHDNIGRVLEEISVLVVPSIWSENSPLVILEAFLSKTPVIASRIGGIPEMVRDGVNGLLCKPKDVDDLREKVTSLISNPLLLDRLTAGILSVKPMEDHAKEIQDTYIRLTQGLPVHNAHDVR